MRSRALEVLEALAALAALLAAPVVAELLGAEWGVAALPELVAPLALAVWLVPRVPAASLAREAPLGRAVPLAREAPLGQAVSLAREAPLGQAVPLARVGRVVPQVRIVQRSEIGLRAPSTALPPPRRGLPFRWPMCRATHGSG